MQKLIQSALGSKFSLRLYLLILTSAWIPCALILGLSAYDDFRRHDTDLEATLPPLATGYSQALRSQILESQRRFAPPVPADSLAFKSEVQSHPASFRIVSLDDAKSHPEDAAILAALDEAGRSALGRGLTVISAPVGTGATHGLALVRQVDANSLIVTEVDTSVAITDSHPHGMLVCVFLGDRALHCPLALDALGTGAVAKTRAVPTSLQFTHEATAYSGVGIRATLEPPLAGAPLTVMVARMRWSVGAYMRESVVTLALGIVFTFAFSIFLGALCVRRALTPTQQLLETIESRTSQDMDDGPEASDKWARLNQQVDSLIARVEAQTRIHTLLSELDLSILQRVAMDRVKAEFLEKLPRVIGIEYAAIAVCDPDTGRISRAYVLGTEGVKTQRVTSHSQTPAADVEAVNNEFVRKRMEELALLETWPPALKSSLVHLSIRTREGFSGVFVYARPGRDNWNRSDDAAMHAIAGRIAVAVAASQKEQQLFLQTRFDHLTRLPNRLLFSDRIVQEIARANRNGHMLALLYIDLDYFKQVNDSLGHSAGDHVLRTVASRLRSSIRESDTVARLSGDEFAVILADLINVRDAGLLARSIIQKLSEPFVINTQQSFLCASIGIAVFPSDGREPESLLRNADIAMYRAKEAGKGRYVFYEERMNRETHHLANLDRELRLAVEHNQFELHFQPQVDLLSGDICGAEALLRWRHPERGLLAPAYFMSHAESSGLIEPLGELVLVKACEHYNRWREKSVAPPRISINVSPRQFKRPDFYRFVENTLKAAGIAPQHLELEVTETVFMEESELPRVNIGKLAALGVRIAIDDFGTGYSSLAYLKRLPFHLLKIDRSFVRDVTSDEDARTIASTIIAMAHSLRKEVLAEGVDHVDQLAFLRSEHCDQVQGYLVSQPVPDEEFVRFQREYLPTRFGLRSLKLMPAESTGELADLG